MNMQNPVSLLRVVAMVEGISFLVLLLVAMPLKYFAEMPMAVKVAGWAHGGLFVLFLIALIYTTTLAGWSIARALLILVAALLPFGPFVLDRRMVQYADELQSSEMP